MRTLLTSYDIAQRVSQFGDADRKVLCEQIPLVEGIVFDRCFLGFDFYNTLREDLETLEADAYNASATYNEGDKICYDGNLYISKISGNTALPSVTNFWERGKKFKSDRFNELWDNYLRDFLINSVLYNALMKLAYKVSGQGIVKVADANGLESISKEEIFALRKDYQTDAANGVQLVLLYIKSNLDKYPEFQTNEDVCGCVDECEPNRPNGQRRFIRKNKGYEKRTPV